MFAGGDWPVWWERTGEGEPVVLVNGLSSPSDTWFRLRRHLADRFSVLTLDNRGTGRTGVPPGPYSIAVMAQDVLAVLDAADVGQAHVVGHSMGGLIAQECALQAPDRVRSLVLAATHAGIPHAEPEEMVAGARLAEAASLEPAERLAVLNTLIYAPSTSPDRIAEDDAVRAHRPTSPEGYLAQLQAAAGWERLAELGRLTMPTLVLHGGLDRLVPPSLGERLANALPAAELTVLPAAAHALFTDAEAEAARVIASFLLRAQVAA